MYHNTLLPALSLLLASTCAGLSCVDDSFEYPDIKGVTFIDITANSVRNYTGVSVIPGTTSGAQYNIDFCNVTVTYTHPGWNDRIHVDVWLPLEDNWNRRLWAVGGSGLASTVGALYMVQAVEKGYVALGTDSGHASGIANAAVADWALLSPKNVNLPLIEDWGYRALGEMTTIGKAIVAQAYSSKLSFSYFAGCSGGGRQGLAIAQRFPGDYDGILAGAPAIDLETFLPGAYWAQQVMHDLEACISACEAQAFTAEAIEACDDRDGLKDGIISSQDLCDFRAESVVGKEFSCNETRSRLSVKGAAVVQAAWDGPRTPKLSVPGLSKDAVLSSTYITTETSSNGTCSLTTTDLLMPWIKYLVVKDATFDLATMTGADFLKYLDLSQQAYSSAIAANDPDLSAFKRAGGKLIIWHGLADETIPPEISLRYYRKVLDLDPKAQDYARYFLAPGVGHCAGGVGPMAQGVFDELSGWVENKIVPEVLVATNANGTRPLCPYPQMQHFVGMNSTTASPGFVCR